MAVTLQNQIPSGKWKYQRKYQSSLDPQIQTDIAVLESKGIRWRLCNSAGAAYLQSNY